MRLSDESGTLVIELKREHDNVSYSTREGARKAGAVRSKYKSLGMEKE